MTNETIEINGREYMVEVHALTAESHPNLYRSMVTRGWVPASYLLTGKRGATYHAYRSATTGQFEIIGKL